MPKLTDLSNAQIDLIAIDLDGTLLADNKTIPAENLKAIEKAQAAGYQIVIATGRSVNGVRRFIDQMNFDPDNLLLLNNGASIHKMDDDYSVLIEHHLDLDQLQAAYRLVAHSHLPVQLVALDLDNFYLISDEPALDIVQKDADTLATPVTAIDKSEYLSNTGILKTLVFGEPDVLDEFEAYARQVDWFDHLTIVRSQPPIIELLLPGINKAYALKELCHQQGIAMNRVMAIGDEMNDIEMLAEVGYSVAMGQASQPVKEVARYQTLSNNEAGVAHVLKHLSYSPDE